MRLKNTDSPISDPHPLDVETQRMGVLYGKIQWKKVMNQIDIRQPFLYT